MKPTLIIVSVLTLLFASCSKEKGCIKGQVIALDDCGSFWAVQILEGPGMGEEFGAYKNVIELYNVPITTRKPGDIIYFTHERTREEDYRPCIAIYPMINYSDVERRMVELSDVACP